MTAALAGLCVGFATLALYRPDIETAIAAYIVGDPTHQRRQRRPRLLRLSSGVAVGSIVGWALLPVPSWTAVVAGAMGGAATQHLWRRHRERQASRRLAQELPAVADFIALYILAGDSVTGSMRHLAAEASGVAVDEIRAILLCIDEGNAVGEVMREAAHVSAHPDGSRLFELLGEAHRSGARLVEALQIYAADRRSAVGEAIAAEGGRRALTGYGPILGLMIPTTLVFLMYPTLAGLDALAAAP